ncbi:MAG: response regulator [Syntrophales bacterium]
MNDYPYTILCVDDEENILSSLRRLLRGEDYRVMTAASAMEGLKVLEENEVHLIISDQRMSGMSGTQFFATVRDQFPETIRIILSGYTDVDAITDSINNGHIYKLLLKPWDDQRLKLEVKQALEYYELKHANKLLYEKVMKQNNDLMNINGKLEEMVKTRTEELEIQNQVLELSRDILENIPVPIIGVSEEGLIVLVNKKAAGLSLAGRNVAVGSEFSDYFPSGSAEILDECLKNKKSRRMEDCRIGEDTYDIDFTPLSGNVSGRGVILSLKLNE